MIISPKRSLEKSKSLKKEKIFLCKFTSIVIFVLTLFRWFFGVKPEFIFFTLFDYIELRI